MLDGPEGLRLDCTVDIARCDLRRILGEVERERDRLIAAWRAIHG